MAASIAWRLLFSSFVLLSVFLTRDQLTEATPIVEGDIWATPNVASIMSGGGSHGYNGLVKSQMHWPNGVVPYVFASNFDTYRRQQVAASIVDFNKFTCVRFVPRTTQRNYVRFMIGNGCLSYIGMIGGAQDISIGDRCWIKGIVIHEMMHAIGFFHEQSRLDRDKYIKIFWQNIYPTHLQSAFQKYSHGEADYYGEPYDLDSVMHYENNAFGKGRTTIEVKGNTHRVIGQRRGFSQIDARMINKMYKCRAPKSTPLPFNHECKDYNLRQCPHWSRIGECQKNYNFMLNTCKKSCNFCAKPSTTVKTKERKLACKDLHGQCPVWKQKGECKRNPVYMNTNCKMSCGLCSKPTVRSPPPKTRCNDNHGGCSGWAARNECKNNPGFMKSQCKKSCNLC